MPAVKKSQKSSTSKRGKKKTNFIIPLTTIGIVSLLVVVSYFNHRKKISQNSTLVSNIETTSTTDIIDLPFPNKNSRFSLEKALNQRRSYTAYQDKPITLNNLSQLLWSAQGITSSWGGRTVASAKSTYPLTIYAISNQITGLEPGLYKYISGDIQPAHQLLTIYKADLKPVLLQNTNQYSLRHAPLIFVITGNMDKMAKSYQGQPHDIQVYLEAGRLAQNLYLQATSINLGLTEIDNIDKSVIKEILEIPQEETIIYLIPVGLPKK